MAAVKGTPRGVSAMWIMTGFDTDSTGQITGATTPVEILLDFIKDTKPTYAASASATSTTFVQARAGSGVTVEVPEVTTVVDGTTGTEKVSGSGNPDKISGTSWDTAPSTVAALAATRGEPCIVCISHGSNLSETTPKYYYLLSQLSSEISFSAQAETFAELALEYTGKSYTADAAGDTALTYVPTAITPVGSSTAITPTPLTAGDLALLKTGAIVQK